MMKAVEWHGPKDLRVVLRPKPVLQHPKDVILRITLSTVCGSDSHLYLGLVPGMEPGDVMGHEFMGIVEQVGCDVHNVRVGDRVVSSFDIACGDCFFCKKQEFSLCETTNPSPDLDKMWGDRLSGMFGYSHLTGGYQGGNAEYTRVPYGDMNLLKVPDHLTDEQVLFLSDIACTSWHGNEFGKVKEGDVVAVWGCGPVGLLTQLWAKKRGASRVIGIDNVGYRLDFAREKIGSEVINFDEVDVVTTLKKMVPRGPDVCIECAGFRFPKSMGHRVQQTLKLEMDALDIVDEQIKSCRKGGRISMIGDYFGYGNGMNIGGLMEKAINLRGGQAFVQRYWHDILHKIETGEFDSTIVITHRMTLDELPKAFKMFVNQEDRVLKIAITRPPLTCPTTGRTMPSTDRATPTSVQ